MQYRKLGNSGALVSVVGLGCNNFGGKPVVAPSGTVYGALDLEATAAVVNAAVAAGINFFDTADVYAAGGSERVLGELLHHRRHQVVIATKWGSGLQDHPDIAWGSRDYIRQAVHASLERLQTDYIDLYQMHWPDPRTPIEVTIDALDELVREGKIRSFGSSHFTGQQVKESDQLATSQGKERFLTAQNHYSLLERSIEAELIPACEKYNVSILPYFPLENGLLTGKYRRGKAAESGRMAGRHISEAVYNFIEALAQFAEARGRTMADIAIGALAAKPVVGSVIAGATSATQIRANAGAASWHPTTEDSRALNALIQANPIGALKAH